MRPIVLTMSAFGPYSQRETIDFTELGARNLFLITGATGAGKTTVFDAISFALFGKASGTLRTEESLRSHFAAMDLATEVELTFELRGTIYHISRRPRQERPKKRGEGTVTDQAKATLIIEDGEPRTVIEGHGNVIEKVEAILGINEQQFKQIMMIPQGEFRKLLMADSKDREKVLRQLFDTYTYRQIQMDLDEQSKELYREISIEHTTINGMLSGIKHGDNKHLQSLLDNEHSGIEQTLEAIEDQIRLDQKEAKILEETLDTTDTKIGWQITKRKEVETDNANLIQLQEAIEKRLSHEAKQDEMAVKKETLRCAIQAAKLIPIEHNIMTREHALEQLNNKVHTLKAELDAQTLVLKKAEEVLCEYRSTAFVDALKAQQKRHIQLTNLQEKVHSLDQLTKDLNVTDISLDKVKRAIETLGAKKENLLKALVDNQENYEKTSDVGVRLEQKKAAVDKLKDTKDKLLKAQEQLEVLENESIELQNHQQQCEALAKDEIEKDRAYKKAKLIFLQNQAAIIARELEADVPCPVCGSTKHPKLAEMPESMVTEEMLDDLEETLKRAQKETESAKTAYASFESSHRSRFNAILEQLEERLKEKKSDSEATIVTVLEWVGTALSTASMALENCSNEEKQLLKEQQQYIALNERIHKQEEEKLRLQKEEEILITKKSELSMKKVELDTRLQQTYREVPREVRTTLALDKAIKEVANAIEKKEQGIEEANKNKKEASEKHIKLHTQVEEVETHIATNEKDLIPLRKNFSDQLLLVGFESEAAYKMGKRTDEEIKTMEAQQKAYHDQFISLSTIIEALEKKTVDKEMTSLDGLDEAIKALQRQRKEQADLLGVVRGRITDNRDIKNRVKASNDKIKDKSDRYNVIGDLAKVAMGNNKAMMTFERFVLARFFEDIITAANIRLKQMTQNRYEMLRSQEVQHRSRQSGLELNVMDHFTGKPRHVKTLSGGESFKASLAMALGLSDVVQSYAGGVHLDTMFIDEGFGTLDQESLDSAINCLIDLQKSGRLVGIISHVQELKERIDARLEVRSGAMGSECMFVIG